MLFCTYNSGGKTSTGSNATSFNLTGKQTNKYGEFA